MLLSHTPSHTITHSSHTLHTLQTIFINFWSILELFVSKSMYCSLTSQWCNIRDLINTMSSGIVARLLQIVASDFRFRFLLQLALPISPLIMDGF